MYKYVYFDYFSPNVVYIYIHVFGLTVCHHSTKILTFENMLFMWLLWGLILNFHFTQLFFFSPQLFLCPKKTEIGNKNIKKVEM